MEITDDLLQNTTTVPLVQGTVSSFEMLSEGLTLSAWDARVSAAIERARNISRLAQSSVAIKDMNMVLTEPPDLARQQTPSGIGIAEACSISAPATTLTLTNRTGNIDTSTKSTLDTLLMTDSLIEVPGAANESMLSTVSGATFIVPALALSLLT